MYIEKMNVFYLNLPRGLWVYFLYLFWICFPSPPLVIKCYRQTGCPPSPSLVWRKEVRGELLYKLHLYGQKIRTWPWDHKLRITKLHVQCILGSFLFTRVIISNQKPPWIIFQKWSYKLSFKYWFWHYQKSNCK